MNTLLLAVAVALGFTLTTTSKADEPFLSPKAAALRHDFRKVPSTDTNSDLVSSTYLGAAAKTESNRLKVVPSGTVTPNLISGNYAGAAAKNPTSTRFEIALLIEKGKAGKTCEKSCCPKK